MSRHARLIERAAGIALTSECRQRHGSIITKGSRILAWGTNSQRNSPEVSQSDITFHAEVAALRRLAYATDHAYGTGDYRGCTLYVARVNTLSQTSLSRPCSNCMRAIVNRGITTVVYTNEFDGFSVEDLRG